MNFGTGKYDDYLCPAGYYCPTSPTRSDDIKPCPAGTYYDKRGAKNYTDCERCPEGFYCPKGSIRPTLCSNGTVCPAGSGSETACGAGTYCPFLSTTPTSTPAGFYNPSTKQDFYLPCVNGTYCATGSKS